MACKNAYVINGRPQAKVGLLTWGQRERENPSLSDQDSVYTLLSGMYLNADNLHIEKVSQ